MIDSKGPSRITNRSTVPWAKNKKERVTSSKDLAVAGKQLTVDSYERKANEILTQVRAQPLLDRDPSPTRVEIHQGEGKIVSVETSGPQYDLEAQLVSYSYDDKSRNDMFLSERVEWNDGEFLSSNQSKRYSDGEHTYNLKVNPNDTITLEYSHPCKPLVSD